MGLLPKPPKRDFIKFMEKDRRGLDSNVLRFLARMNTTKPIDQERRFIISYYLSDDTISVFEPPVRNSGIYNSIRYIIFSSKTTIYKNLICFFLLHRKFQLNSSTSTLLKNFKLIRIKNWLLFIWMLKSYFPFFRNHWWQILGEVKNQEAKPATLQHRHVPVLSVKWPLCGCLCQL